MGSRDAQGTEVAYQLVWLLQSQSYEVKYRTGMYVRVHGHIRSFDGQMSMNCFKIRPITDFNEARSMTVVTHGSCYCSSEW